MHILVREKGSSCIFIFNTDTLDRFVGATRPAN
jgi:hypothetical protein